jgi:hypothetical protein
MASDKGNFANGGFCLIGDPHVPTPMGETPGIEPMMSITVRVPSNLQAQSAWSGGYPMARRPDLIPEES